MLSQIKGVTDRRLKFLLKMGIVDVFSLLAYAPRKYIDMDNIQPLGSCKEGELCISKVKICSEPKVRYIRKNMSITEMKVTDGAYTIDCYWFNQPYVVKKDVTKEYYLIGKVTVMNGKRRFSSPSLEPVESTDSGIVPIYSLPKGFRQKEFRTIIKNAIGYVDENNVLISYNNLHILDAVKNLHFPKDWERYYKAIDVMKFSEAVNLSCAFDLLTPNNVSYAMKFNEDILDRFIQNLPFEMTDSQKKACYEIMKDMSRDKSMNRLLQGNVGCGKTVVAIFALYINYINGYQGMLMSPTEVLALQNYNAVKKYLPGANVAYLVGSSKKSVKNEILRGLSDGTIDIVVGTHSLIQDNILTDKVNLVITDEQHRFGVKQRAKLSKAGCHTLIMSATPIPRTLALIAFNKLDLSIINEMPKGREPVSTHIIVPDKRDGMYGFVKDRCMLGEQAYVVCPVIDKSEITGLKSAKEIYEELSTGILKDCDVALLHGRMKAEEKEDVLRRFRDGEIHVLVSTTVIEVGVDVPNATVIVIENSDRFGLAALHQLRGRVGRGNKKSYCFTVVYNEESCERLNALKQTTDGYEIALMDLSMRGVGELTGTNQHGGNILKFIDLSKDKEVLTSADEYIQSIKGTETYQQIKKNTLRIYDNLLEDIILN